MTTSFEGPGYYRIVVQGELDVADSDYFGGMNIRSTSRAGARAPVTTLEGHLLDQSQLVGILNTLYDIHLPILEVENLGSEVRRI